MNDESHIYYDADNDTVEDIIEFIIRMDIDGEKKSYSIVSENNLLAKNKFDITLGNETDKGSISLSVNDITYTAGWLKITFNLEMTRQSCYYDSSIIFNESGVPTTFDLNNMTDLSNMFAHLQNKWEFVNEDGTAVDFTIGTDLSSMCYDSSCTIFKGKNTAAENCDCMMCMCPNLTDFTIEGISTRKRNGEVTQTVSPYENVKTARHMFFNTSPYNSSFDVDMKSLTNATAMFYKRGKITLNKYEFNTKRENDFTSINITLPALETAPMMFWNRPLTLAELTTLADNINDISDLRTDFNKSLKDSDEDVTWEDSVNYIRTAIGDKFIFPSISVWVDESENMTKVLEKIHEIAEKGWEVSTNIDCSNLNVSNTVEEVEEEVVEEGEEETEETIDVLVAPNGEYLIRAYEYGNNTLESFICDEKLMSSALDNVNYLVDICKSVVNPIKCEEYEDWIKLCMMWSGVSIPSDNKERRKYGISQVLGTIESTVETTDEITIESTNGYGVISKATLFDGTPNKRYCDKSWFEGTIKDFRKNYNLYFKK